LSIASTQGRDLPDVQSAADERSVAIDRVGVSSLRHPATIVDADGTTQLVAATFTMTVSLPPEVKGTHMSRFLQVLAECQNDLGPKGLHNFARELTSRLNSESAQVVMTFPWFVDKPAPVTGEVGLLEYMVTMNIDMAADGTATQLLKVAVPATSLCPCSKEISEYGAHNQRCELTAEIETKEPMGIGALGSRLEAAASCEVFPVLKRPDEKHVTEVAFENPKFVEDIIRDIALELDRDQNITKYKVTSENFESIHSHNAWAEISRSK
jgi:MptA/FolE2 family GTP cyclohydrolase